MPFKHRKLNIEWRKRFLLFSLFALVLFSGCSHRTGQEDNSSFEIHFIDVGQGDAALVLCDGEAMLIDGGGREKSSLMYSYLKNLGVDSLKFVVATHPDEDHIGGLAGALNFAAAEMALCPVTQWNTETFKNFKKYATEQCGEITVPVAFDKYSLGSAEIEILAPTQPSENSNDNSIVLKISYRDTSFLFTGDAEFDEEAEMMALGQDLHADLIKIAHHGSKSSTSMEFLQAVSPEFRVISVGKSNSYGHPTQIVLDRLEQNGVKLYRTDLDGNIICKSDGKGLEFFCEKKGEIPTKIETSTAQGAAQYVLNTHSRKFHYPTCDSVSKMSEKNKEFFTGDRESLVSDGYSPCHNCNP